MTQPRDFSLYGAVDLGARKAAAQRAQQASRAGGPGGPGGANGHVFDVTEATFETDVLERAKTHPALIIFDLNYQGVDALKLVQALKADSDTKGVSLIGYLSHVQGELKVNSKLDGTFQTVTPKKNFDVFVTGENDSTVKSPSGPEVLRTSVSR